MSSSPSLGAILEARTLDELGEMPDEDLDEADRKKRDKARQDREAWRQKKLQENETILEGSETATPRTSCVDLTDGHEEELEEVPKPAQAENVKEKVKNKPLTDYLQKKMRIVASPSSPYTEPDGDCSWQKPGRSQSHRRFTEAVTELFDLYFGELHAEQIRLHSKMDTWFSTTGIEMKKLILLNMDLREKLTATGSPNSTQSPTRWSSRAGRSQQSAMQEPRSVSLSDISNYIGPALQTPLDRTHGTGTNSATTGGSSAQISLARSKRRKRSGNSSIRAESAERRSGSFSDDSNGGTLEKTHRSSDRLTQDIPASGDRLSMNARKLNHDIHPNSEGDEVVKSPVAMNYPLSGDNNMHFHDDMSNAPSFSDTSSYTCQHRMRKKKPKRRSPCASPPGYAQDGPRWSPQPSEGSAFSKGSMLSKHHTVWSIEDMHNGRVLEQAGIHVGKMNIDDRIIFRSVVPRDSPSTSMVNTNDSSDETSTDGADEYEAKGGDQRQNQEAGAPQFRGSKNLESLRRLSDHAILSGQGLSRIPVSALPITTNEFTPVLLAIRTTLRIMGAMPRLGSHWVDSVHKHAAYMLAVCSTAFVALQTMPDVAKAYGEQDGHTPRAIQHAFGSALPFMISWVLGLFFMRGARLKRYLGTDIGPLEEYAFKNGLVDAWSIQTGQRMAVLATLWLVVVMIRGAIDFYGAHTEPPGLWHSDIVAFLFFVVGSFAFTAVAAYLWHVLILLEMMVDYFCINFFAARDVRQGILDWNVIQAVLRQATGAFDLCFLLIQGMGPVMLAASAVVVHLSEDEFEDFWFQRGTLTWLPSTMLVICAGVMLLFAAAAVTEKCSRVPSLLGSMLIVGEKDVLEDHDRQCILQFITMSDAGFYIKEVRLTSSIAFKVTYVTGICAFALITKLAA
eukprot:gnl/TRDRNA2_/TRDRNA2_28633_c0_seq1.p1 gnl/TRDRNA2_/TRDRNA2_28633_c0~~gnl/TRDRNA2_/TRDRNA2_28633_c0_seq1.p1  ORF type:complete len:904 (+),score=123.77 gnl/TRDRNA2_/TRDRNA2_28633_c0_seq1:80-2791(+)